MSADAVFVVRRSARRGSNSSLFRRPSPVRPISHYSPSCIHPCSHSSCLAAFASCPSRASRVMQEREARAGAKARETSSFQAAPPTRQSRTCTGEKGVVHRRSFAMNEGCASSADERKRRGKEGSAERAVVGRSKAVGAADFERVGIRVEVERDLARVDPELAVADLRNRPTVQLRSLSGDES